MYKQKLGEKLKINNRGNLKANVLNGYIKHEPVEINMQIGRRKTNKSKKLNNGFSTVETNQKIIVKVHGEMLWTEGATFIVPPLHVTRGFYNFH